MTKLVSLAAISLLAATLAGCSSPASRSARPSLPAVDEIDGAPRAADLSSRSVYFVENHFAAEEEGQKTISEWADYLATHRTVHARLEGNTDERGRDEANLALGERRAKSVAAVLEQHGIEASRITIVSNGSSHPAAIGHDAASWRINRRVDLILCFRDECPANR